MHVRVPISSFVFNTLRPPPCPPSSCLSTTSPHHPSHSDSATSTSSPLLLLSRSERLRPPSLASMAGTGAATATVCSMCGDVGFPEKLFRCGRCRHRFQHSYCTNYYGDSAPASAGSDMCDWCVSDVAGKQARWSSSISSPAGKQLHATTGSQESSSTTTSSGGSGRGGAGGGKASGGHLQAAEAGGRRATTRAAGRRYKLLKDVLCE